MDQTRKRKVKIIFAGAYRGEGSFPEHEHPYSWEILYLSEGRLAERVEDRLIEMHPGMFIVHPPGVRHSDVSDSPRELFHTQLHCQGVPPWPQLGSDDDIRSLGATLQSITKEWYNAEPERELMLGLLATRLDLLLCRNAWLQTAGTQVVLVAKAEGILRKHFAGGVEIEDLADALGVSRSTLYSCFKEVRGWSPNEALNRLRLNHAVFLLRHTKMSIAEIAESVGFCSTSHFDRRLKELTGFTPRTLRQNGCVRNGKPVVIRSGHSPLKAHGSPGDNEKSDSALAEP